MLLLWVVLGISCCLTFLWFYLSVKVQKGEPPISKGTFLFLGDLNLMAPGLWDFIDNKRKELGDVFTVYCTGSKWTFIFNEDDLKTYFNTSEKIVSSQKFLEFMLEPMQPFSMAQLKNITENMSPFILMHKLFNTTEQLQIMLQNNEEVINSVLDNEWKNKKEVNLFDEIYNTIFKINIKNFAGNEAYENNRKEFLELFLKCDYSKLDVLKETFMKKIGIQTNAQAAYHQMGQIYKKIIEQRMKEDIEQNDILGNTIQYVRKKIKKEDGELYEIINMMIFNMLIASQITTSATTLWFFVNILQSKDEKLKEDIMKEINNCPSPMTLDYLNNKMPVTTMAIYEAVRFGLLGIGARILTQDVQFGKYVVPAGNIVINPYYGRGSHLDNSEYFDPYRFDGFKDNVLLAPFGLGKHPCAGKSIALNVIKSMMILIFKKFELNLTDEIKPVKKCMQNFNRNLPDKPVIVQLKKL